MIYTYLYLVHVDLYNDQALSSGQENMFDKITLEATAWLHLYATVCC